MQGRRARSGGWRGLQTHLPLETARIEAREPQPGVRVCGEDKERWQVACGEVLGPLGQVVGVIGAQREVVEQALQRLRNLHRPPGRRGGRD